MKYRTFVLNVLSTKSKPERATLILQVEILKRTTSCYTRCVCCPSCKNEDGCRKRSIKLAPMCKLRNKLQGLNETYTDRGKIEVFSKKGYGMLQKPPVDSWHFVHKVRLLLTLFKWRNKRYIIEGISINN